MPWKRGQKDGENSIPRYRYTIHERVSCIRWGNEEERGLGEGWETWRMAFSVEEGGNNCENGGIKRRRKKTRWIKEKERGNRSSRFFK